MDKHDFVKALASSVALCIVLAMSLSAAQMKTMNAGNGKDAGFGKPQMHLFVDVFVEDSPAANGVPQTGSDKPAIFKLLQRAQLAWTPFTYNINVGTRPSTIAEADAIDAFVQAFETWDAQVTPNLFEYAGDTDADALDWSAPDAEHSIFFMNLDDDPVLSSLYPGLTQHIIAVTLTWFAGPGAMSPNGNGFHYQYIIDFDMAYNTNILGGRYPWSTDDTFETWDLREIALHEAGHTLFLDDLYMDAASGQTMYGYGLPIGVRGHVRDWTLGTGDIKGIQTIYVEARQ